MKTRFLSIMLFILAISSQLNAQITINTASPVTNALVPVGQKVTLDFSTTTNSKIDIDSSIVVYGSLRGDYGQGLSNLGTKSLIYTPSKGFTANDRLKISVTNKITDNGGAAISNPQVFSYRVLAKSGFGSFDDAFVFNSDYADVDPLFQLADMDKNGYTDVVVYDTQGHILLHPNDGTKYFDPSYFDVSSGAIYMHLADLKADGYSDIILVTNEGQILIYNNNNGNINTTPQVVSLQGLGSMDRSDSYVPFTGDIDADGDLDMVMGTGASISVIYNQKFGTAYTQKTVSPGAAGSGKNVSLVDTDNDGDLDILTESGNVGLNDGKGAFSAFTNVATTVYATEDVDIDGDGDIDLVQLKASTGKGVDIVVNFNTAGKFSTSKTYNVALNSNVADGLVSGDFDANGSMDIAFSSFDDAAYAYLLNDGKGNLGAVQLQYNKKQEGLLSADMDNDGDLDLVSITIPFSSNYKEVNIFYNIPPCTNLNVTRTDDNYQSPKCGSLRYAIDYANSNPGYDTITFDASISGKTISSVGSYNITEGVAIISATTDKITVDASKANDRLFNIYLSDQKSPSTVVFDGLDLSNVSTTYSNESNPGPGGAIGFVNSNASLIVKNCGIFNNNYYDGGSGIYFEGVNLTIDNCDIEDNTLPSKVAGLNGAGIMVGKCYNSNILINNSTIAGNYNYNPDYQFGVSDSLSSNGNGLYIGSNIGSYKCTINGSTFSNNNSNSGGAIYYGGDGKTDSLVIINSTFSGNKAYRGGAIISSGQTNLYNVTISENAVYEHYTGCGYFGPQESYVCNYVSSLGGGIFVSSGNVLSKNTINAKNIINSGNSTDSKGIDVYIAGGQFVSQGNNLIGVSDDANSTLSLKTTDKSGTLSKPLSPVLSDFGLNGGPTKTYLPLVGSLAINNGGNYKNIPSVDQRGLARKIGASVDIGAVEAAACSSPYVVTSRVDSFACGTLRYAIGVANVAAGEQAITFSSSLKNDSIVFASMINIKEGLSITGVAGLALSGGGNVGIFNSTTSSSTSKITYKNLIFRNADASDNYDYAPITHNGKGTITFKSCGFINNITSYQGGALKTYAGNVIIDSCRFINNINNCNNEGPGYGGAVSFADSAANTLSINHSTFSSNTYDGYELLGGAIYIYSKDTSTSVKIENSTFDNNAASSGGAIYYEGNNSKLDVINSTISSNNGDSNYGNGGGGFYIQHVKGKFVNTTIYGNSSKGYNTGGGGMSLYNSQIQLLNTVFANNKSQYTVGNDLYNDQSTITSLGYNFVSDTTATGFNQGSARLGSSLRWENTDIVGDVDNILDPKLFSLANNGGSTRTHLPKLGSPLVNNGSNVIGITLPLDQRGQARIQNTTIDIGSVEAAPYVMSAGADTSICDSLVYLKGTPAPSGYTGMWSVVNKVSKGIITDSTLFKTTAKIAKVDTLRFVWSILDDEGVILLSDTMKAIRKALPAKPTVTTPVKYCNGATTVALTPSGANLLWYTVAIGGTGTTTAPKPVTTTNGTVSYYVAQKTNGCEGPRAQVNVITNPLPATPTVGSNSPQCVGSALNLTSTIVAGTTNSWTGPNSFTSTAQNPSIASPTIAASGTYNVVATLTATGCKSTTGSTTVVVNPIPAQTSAISGSSTICAGDSGKYSVTPVAGLSYAWSYSGGNGTIVVTGDSIRLKTSSTTTSGNLQVTASANGCVSIPRVLAITINPVPAQPTLNGNLNICSGSNAQFSANTITGATYFWTGPNGFSSTNQNPIITNVTADAAGTYSAQVVVSGCVSKTSTTTLTIKPLPVTIGSKSIVQTCIGDSVLLNATPITNATYFWIGPNEFSSPFISPKIPNSGIQNAGNYIVTYTLNGCVGDRDTVQVNINPIPSAIFAYNKDAYCIYEPNASPINVPTGSKFSVTPFGLVLNSSTGDIDFSASSVGNYTISDSVTSTQGCKSSTQYVLQVNPKPTKPIISGACQASTPPVTLTTQYSSNQTYSGIWFKDNAMVSEGTALVASNLGIYKTIVTDLSTGCTSDTSSGVDPFGNALKISLNTGTNPFCQGDSLTLSSVSSSGNSWKLDGVLVSTAQTAVVKKAGKLLLEVVNGKCTGKDSLIVVTSPTPPIPIITSLADTVCSGEIVQLNTNSNASLQWLLDGLVIESVSGSSLQVSNPGSYQVKASIGGCSSISSVKKVVFKPLPAKPLLSLSGVHQVCKGDSLGVNISNFVANQDVWYKSGSVFSTSDSLKLKLAGYYNVVRTIQGCQAYSDTIQLDVNVCTVAAFAGKDTSICSNSYGLAASIEPNYQTAWRVLSGSASISDSTASAKLTNLAPGATILRWVLKSNGAEVGSDTITIINNTVSKANAGNYINTCKPDTALDAAALLAGEKGKWTSLGTASIENDTLINTPVHNLTPYDSLNPSNKFVWTVSKANCTSKDTALVYYSVVVITVKDTKSGIAGKDIDVPVLVNDKYSLGDKLTVSGDWKKSGSIDSVYVIGDSLVRFKTNAKIYVKNYSFNYFLANQCPSARDTGIVILNSTNEPPKTAVTQLDSVFAGTKNTLKRSVQLYDSNPNIDSLSIVPNPNLAGILKLSFNSDSSQILFEVDYTQQPRFVGTELFQFRVFDIDENGVRTFADQFLSVTVKPSAITKQANAGSDQIICEDTTTLGALAVQGYSGTWSVAKGNAVFNDNTLANTKVTALVQDTNMLVWTLKQNGQDIGKDTVLIINKLPMTQVVEFVRSCDTNAVFRMQLVPKEKITFTNIGIASIVVSNQDSTEFNVSKLESFPKINKFAWKISNTYCSKFDTLEYYLADSIISIADSIPGIAGDTIKVKVSSVSLNDVFVKGEIFDSLIVEEISSSQLNIVVDKFSVGDTAVYFVTNRKIYGKEFYTYRLKNSCGVKSNIATLIIKSRNVTPRKISKEVKIGSDKIVKVRIPIIELDSNRYLKSITLVQGQLPSGVQARYEYDTDSNWVTFIIDVTNAQQSPNSESVQFRICDDVDCSDLTFILEPTEFSDAIKVYNALSPNGDGKHDVLEIENILLYPDNKIRIFNRWGDKIYSAQGYNNTSVVFEGGSLPDGTYYYVLEPGNGRKILEGFIVIKR